MPSRIIVPLLSIVLTALAASLVSAQAQTVEQVLAGHLKSFGNAKALAASKNRMAVGTSSFQIVSTAKSSTGSAAFASDENNLAFFATFGLRDYRMERIGLFDQKITIPVVEQGRRSPLGSFLNSYDRLLASRLFGGPIFTTWLLYSKPGSDVGDLTFDGKKNLNGTDAYVLKFVPKGGLFSGSYIKLYFDAKNYHLVRTLYRQIEKDRGTYNSMGTPAGNAPNGWDQDMASNGSTLTEDFSDYSNDAAGISLPHKYAIHLAIDSVHGTAQFDWKFVFTEYKLIKSFPPDFFAFKANAGG